MPAPPLWSRARLLAALLVVPVLLFGPIVAAGQVFLPFLPVVGEPLARENPAAAAEARRALHATMGDRVYPFLVDQVSARKELQDGHLPTWEPLQTLGMPLFGGNITALGYPPNWLAFLLAPERAAAPLAGLALFLAGLGTWLFLSCLGLDPRAALVGALGCQLGGWGLENLHYYMKVDSALWLPWALWAVEGLARGRRLSATALVTAVTLAFLGGMVSVAVFVFDATALYALVRLGPWAGTSGFRRARLRPPIPDEPPAPSRANESRWRLPRVALLLLLGVAGSAYWVLPLAEAGDASLRRPMSLDVALASTLPASTALGTLVPDLIGPFDSAAAPGDLPLAWWLTPASQAVRAENANVLEWNAYALTGLVLLALAGLVADPRRAAFPGLLLLGCFAFAQGWPGVRWLFLVPGHGLGAPPRVLGLAWGLWPWLAALGVEALIARRARALATLLVGAFVAALGLLHAWNRLEPASWAGDLLTTLVARYPDHGPEEVEARLPLVVRMAAGEHLRDSLLRAGCAALAVLLAGVGARLLERRAPRFEQGPPLAGLLAGLGVVLGAALLPFALSDGLGARGPQALLGLSGVLALAGLSARAGRGDLALWLPFAALILMEGFLASWGNVRGRALPEEGLFPPSPMIEVIREAAGDGRVLRVDATPDLADSQRLARPNMLIPYGIADLTPYTTFTPRQAPELAARIDPRMVRRNHVAPLPDAALLGHPLLDLLRARCVLTMAPLLHPRLAPVLERPGFCVYRRTGALPAARIVPRAEVGANDEAILAALAAPDADYAARTLLAAEDGARLPTFEAGPGWAPGTITAVEHPAKNRVRVSVSEASGGWLVLHEQWAPGWRASIDGRPVPLFRGDHYCRVVPLPADTAGAECVVEFAYAPRSLEWGATLTLAAWLGVLAWDLLNRR